MSGSWDCIEPIEVAAIDAYLAAQQALDAEARVHEERARRESERAEEIRGRIASLWSGLSGALCGAHVVSLERIEGGYRLSWEDEDA